MKELLKKIRTRFHNDLMAKMNADKQEIISIIDANRKAISDNEEKSSAPFTSLYNEFSKICFSLSDKLTKDFFWAYLMYRINYDYSGLISVIMNWDKAIDFIENNVPNSNIMLLHKNKKIQKDIFILCGSDNQSYVYYKSITNLGYDFLYILNDDFTSFKISDAARFGLEAISLKDAKKITLMPKY
jgi:hypothetical protein